MKIVFLSDIHANLEALSSVKKEIDRISPDRVILLGDIVGYGADPSACLKIVRDSTWNVIAGNHDLSVAEKLDISLLNPYAQRAVLWTKDQLSEGEKSYLGNLPLVYKSPDFNCVHSSLVSPEKFSYLDNYPAVYRDIDFMRAENIPLSFIAHTHIPAIFIQRGGNLYRDYSKEIEINSKYRYIINIGSVGQPRDRDPKSCFCLFDTENMVVKFIRSEYNIKPAQDKIIKALLPSVLAVRLEGGW